MWPDRHITIHLFHKLLKSCHKLINGLILPLTDIPGHTGADVIGKQFFVKRIHSCIHSSRLDQDIITVGIILKHTDDTPDLSFNTLQPVDQLLTLLLGSVCMLFAAAAVFLFSHGILSFLRIPRMGIPRFEITIYPIRVFCQGNLHIFFIIILYIFSQ